MPLTSFLKRNRVLAFAITGLCLFLFLGRLAPTGFNSPKNLSDPLRKDTIMESVYGIGIVMANRSFQFKPGIVTSIQNLFVKEGDKVEQGRKLLELERGVIISAPFSGTVTSLPVKVGENVFMQSVILELVDLQDRYVTVSLEQRAAIKVRRGQNARLSFENLREKSFEGNVESVYSSDSHFIARIEVKELPPQILPGMTADVAISIRERKDTLLIPVAALGEGTVIVKRENKKPFSTAVKIGLVDGTFAEVIAGDVKPGDRLVLPAKKRP
ncbi:MAG: efflux RND transporter periplasmic adaptor subunit [Candidatus Omnitrophica bacterium]|nr:efflux RND transporter periplasmic adaptor subunit [Candidatus Omnitrophota bacterium]